MIDEEKLEALIERFVGDSAAAAHAATVVLGDELGLYKELAAAGPLTPGELARRTGCDERLIEEWVSAQVVSEYCSYDPATGRCWLTPEQTACLADEGGPAFLVGNARIASTLHLDISGVAEAFTNGRGYGWHEHHAELFTSMAQASAADYGSFLVPEWIPALDGVEDKLRRGARVADVGCGFGGPTILLAQAYPASVFHGFDYHDGSIDAARKAAAEAGVGDRVTFEVAFADSFPGEGYDLICTFDAFHDMGNPVGVARHIHDVLAHDGTWMLVELNAGERLEDNVGPFGRLLYSASTFICVPNALSNSRDRALGAGAGEARLRDVAEEAGFRTVRRAAESPFNIVLDVRP